MTTLSAGPQGPLTVTAGEADLQVFDRGGVGAATLIVTVTNRSDSPLALHPAPAEALADTEPLARCPYERAVVWQTAGERRRFTAFQGPLAPGETLTLKLFYRWPAQVAAPKGPLRYRVRFPAGEHEVDLTTPPFTPSHIGGAP